MSAALSPPQLPVPVPVTGEEQRLVIHSVTWKDYVILRDVLDGPSPRMTYLDGALELMAPSREHELWKKNIARLIEHYAYRKNIDLRGYGSTTFKQEAEKAGAEPDECYVIGEELGEFPEMVLEVIYAAPLLDKLSVYARMRVPEVWVFKNAAFTIHRFDPKTRTYELAARSAFLPDLDFARIAAYAVRPDINRALAELEAEIR